MSKNQLVKDDPTSLALLSAVLNKLDSNIRLMSAKRGTLLLNWLAKKMDLVLQESSFVPSSRYFGRGQIVHVDFGFNVGHEFGGGHFAVVLWSERAAGTATVIPLTSEELTFQSNFPFHVDLGTLLEDTKLSIGKVEQIRAVSKLRIRRIYLTDPNGNVRYKTDRLTGGQLDLIDDAVRTYTSRAAELNAYYRTLTQAQAGNSNP